MPDDPSPLSPLEAAIAAIVSWFDAERVPALFIGGVAVSLVARPRTTKDVDAVVWLPDPSTWAAFVAAGVRHGVVPRIDDALVFANESRMLLLRHAPSDVEIDIALGALPFEEIAIARADEADIGGTRIPVPTPEDLIILKSVAHRPRDLIDIASIVEVHPGLDADRVLVAVREFADLLDTPELVDEIGRLLSADRS